jgi:predicted RNase H-like nuclease (RuvC/YqgF family)|tara:strand:+ start:95 stop:328 length:234 start_codon:yes stop_codon:yes gene_type:complete
MWFNIFRLKEENMSTAAESAKVRKLTKTIDNQADLISTLLTRVSQLADDVHILKTDLDRFKNNVADDVKYLTDRIDG